MGRGTEEEKAAMRRYLGLYKLTWESALSPDIKTSALTSAIEHVVFSSSHRSDMKAIDS